MKVGGGAQIWVIPTESGMLEVPNVESDPHNLAAFNALLSSLPKAPSGSAEWNAVGKLYMTLVGHTGAVPIESQPTPCTPDGECTLTFADRVPHVKQPYTKWTLTFSAASGSSPVRIDDAAREVVSPAESPAEPIDKPATDTLLHESGHVDPPKPQ